MNTRQTSWLIVVLSLFAPSLACANDMTMVIPMAASPFLIAGIVGSIVIGAVPPGRKSKTVVTTLQVLIIIVIGLPSTFVLSLCVGYLDSRYADIAGFLSTSWQTLSEHEHSYNRKPFF